MINALVEGKLQHVPYRESKLTRLLQNSLGEPPSRAGGTPWRHTHTSIHVDARTAAEMGVVCVVQLSALGRLPGG